MISKLSLSEVSESLGISLVILILVYMLCRPVVVSGPSMEDTLMDGDILLVAKILPIHQNDIIIAEADDTYVVKRVIGCPGDTVDGKVIPKGKYYIEGDNRNESYDSRDYGPVSEIKGKVICRILPKPHFFRRGK